jgi:stringent starvation protein B
MYSTMPASSTKPYFMRAIYEWCTDNGFTPYLSVKVYGGAKVPMEFVRNGEIVLNISFGATSGLKMDNNAVAFNARFGGVSREIYVPIENVQAVYASENGQGMAFEMDVEELSDKNEDPSTAPVKPAIGLAAVSNTEPDGVPVGAKPEAEPQKKFEKPTLKIIK